MRLQRDAEQLANLAVLFRVQDYSASGLEVLFFGRFGGHTSG